MFLSPLNNGSKPFFQLVKHGFMAELVGFAKCNTKSKDGRYENKYSKFTKSELAEINDGTLYVPEQMPGEIHMDGEVYESGYYPEWINPLIELVPVEDGE
ncbi:hypothetical protein [Lactococcus lactis]|uniref:hypothetical protein n=1 Tax=Lactococcus lactis TaxID=1358 RepID=UPI0024A7C44A|nr:hypothetical protein [Lactococcus lactis]